MQGTGILVDPNTRTVTEVELKGDYTAIYPLIDAQRFDAVHFGDDGDSVLVDDEGLMFEGNKVWNFSSVPHQPIIGKGLIVGIDTEGETVGAVISIDQVRNSIEWTNLVTTGS